MEKDTGRPDEEPWREDELATYGWYRAVRRHRWLGAPLLVLEDGEIVEVDPWSVAIPQEALDEMGYSIDRVRIEFSRLTVTLDDSREISVPIAGFPRLAAASEEALHNYRLIGPGWGIHWPDLDEDVSVESLLYPERMISMRRPSDEP